MGISRERNEFLVILKILRRDPLSIVGAIVSIAFIATSFAVIMFGKGMVPYDPTGVNLSVSFRPPSIEHLMGTDALGRDIFSRAIVAAPIDAEVAFVLIIASILIGITIGSISGYVGGRADEIIMRITDVFLAFPMMVLAVAAAVALGPGVDHVIEACLVGWWTVYARMARAGALSLRDSQFIEAARVAGLSRLSIIGKHIIPNNISPLIVYATLDLGSAILYASVLSYLGLGAQPPQAEWGRMVFDGQAYISTAWWISIMPGLVIFIVAMGFNLMGDALRDALNPRYRR